MQLTAQQKQFFDTFGFLVFPGLMKDEIDWITAEFRAVFDDKGVQHSPDKRTCMFPFIDQREKLSTLLDHPSISGIASSLLGEDFNYLASDGNYYTGDTAWHSDGWNEVGTYIKIAFYLDPVDRDSGALRVIPGTHRLAFSNWEARDAPQAPELWGIAQAEVPSVALKSTPGDVVVFNHNLMHAAFGGSSQRRMFTLNLGKHASTEPEIKNLENYINGHARFWNEKFFGATMLDTASDVRQTHLQQVIDHSTQLPALVEQARQTMSEPASG